MTVTSAYSESECLKNVNLIGLIIQQQNMTVSLKYSQFSIRA